MTVKDRCLRCGLQSASQISSTYAVKMIRVVIPYHLKMLAQVTGEVELDVPAPITLKAAIDALEARYPMLRGTIRDQATGERRRS